MSLLENRSHDSKICFGVNVIKCANPSEVHTENFHPYELSREDQRIIGAISTAIIVVCFSAYLPVLWIFIRRPYFYKRIAYQIIIHIALVEMLYQIVFFYSCITITFDTYFSSFLGKLNMACRTFSWWSSHLFAVTLAFNRSDSIVGFLRYFIKNPIVLFKFLIWITYATSLTLWIIYWVPGFQAEARGIEVIRQQHNRELAPILIKVAFFLDFIGYLFYLVAIVQMIYTRLKTKTWKKVIRGPELSLLVQSFIICGYKSLMIIVWQYLEPPTKFIYCIYYLLNILEFSYNPFMYFIFIKYAMIIRDEKKLREELYALFKLPFKRNNQIHNIGLNNNVQNVNLCI